MERTPADERDNDTRLPASSLTEEFGFSEMIRSVQEGTRIEMEDNDNVIPRAVLIITKDPNGGKSLDEPGIMFLDAGMIPHDFNTVEGKDVFSNFLKTAALHTGAIGIIFFSECWMTAVALEEDGLKQLHGRPASKYSDRQETVFMSCEHKKVGRSTWRAPITTVNGKRVIGEYEKLDYAARGRFTGFLAEFGMS